MQFLKSLVLLGVFFASTSAFSATYYVKPDGDDNQDGRSHATAWRTIAKVNAFGFNTGDDVYFLGGGVWHDSQLRVDWGGTASDRVIIGTYSLQNATAVPQIGANGRAEINGTYESSCRQANPSTCALDTAGAVPSNHYSGLVNVGTSYVTVRDLKIVDSAGAGIRHEGGNSETHVTVENNEIRQVFGAAIWFDYAAYGVARNNTINLSALERVDGRYTSWGGAIVLNDSRPSYGLVEGNTISNTGGESIITIRSTHIVIRGNTISNSRRPAVDLDNTSDSIVESNMMLGNGYLDGVDESFGAAITISVEPFGAGNTFDSVRNVVRNNLMANTRACFDLSMFRSSVFNCSTCNDPAADGRKIGAKIHGNTCMQSKSNYIQSDEGLTVNNNVDKIEIKNNIFVGKSGANCTFPTLPSNRIDIANNVYYPAAASDPDCTSSSDIVGDPGIPLNFAGAKTGNIPTVQSFKPAANSAAAGVGSPLTSSIINLSNYHPDYASSVTPCTIVDSTELSYDFSCVRRSSPPDAGALAIDGSPAAGGGGGGAGYTLSVD